MECTLLVLLINPAGNSRSRPEAPWPLFNREKKKRKRVAPSPDGHSNLAPRFDSPHVPKPLKNTSKDRRLHPTRAEKRPGDGRREAPFAPDGGSGGAGECSALKRCTVHTTAHTAGVSHALERTVLALHKLHMCGCHFDRGDCAQACRHPRNAPLRPDQPELQLASAAPRPAVFQIPSSIRQFDTPSQRPIQRNLALTAPSALSRHQMRRYHAPSRSSPLLRPTEALLGKWTSREPRVRQARRGLVCAAGLINVARIPNLSRCCGGLTTASAAERVRPFWRVQRARDLRQLN